MLQHWYRLSAPAACRRRVMSRQRDAVQWLPWLSFPVATPKAGKFSAVPVQAAAQASHPSLSCAKFEGRRLRFSRSAKRVIRRRRGLTDRCNPQFCWSDQGWTIVDPILRANEGDKSGRGKGAYGTQNGSA